MLLGQVIAGGCVSFTVTVKEHVAVLPAPSVAVQVTVVRPTGNVEPDTGEQTTVGDPQLSVADAVNETTAEHWPAAAGTLMGDGQVIDGGVVSTTVTVAMHWLAAPLSSLTVSVTVVIPRG
jgi:hypothetical protein